MMSFMSFKGRTDMPKTDRNEPEISEGWQGTSEDSETNSGRPRKVAVIGAGVTGLGEWKMEQEQHFSRLTESKP